MWYVINKNRQLRVAIFGDSVDKTLPLAQKGTYDIESNGIVYHMERIKFLRYRETIADLVPNDSHTQKVWISIRKRMGRVLNSFIGDYAEIPIEPVPFSYKIMPGTILEKDKKLYLAAASQEYIRERHEAILYPLEETIAKEPYYRDCEKYREKDTLKFYKDWLIFCLEVHGYSAPTYVCGEHSLYADLIHPVQLSIDKLSDFNISRFISKKYYDFFKLCNQTLISHVFKTDWKA